MARGHRRSDHEQPTNKAAKSACQHDPSDKGVALLSVALLRLGRTPRVDAVLHEPEHANTDGR